MHEKTGNWVVVITGERGAQPWETRAYFTDLPSGVKDAVRWTTDLSRAKVFVGKAAGEAVAEVLRADQLVAEVFCMDREPL